MKKFASGTSVEIFETLDSTSTEARRRAEKGDSGPAWILALHQTAGYGRRGRSWSQESGDFAGSLLFALDADAETLGQLSFVVALAVHDALARYAANKTLRIKWPNDILLDGAKVSGLLLELVDGPGGKKLIAGIGVNVVSKPENVAYPTARLLDLGVSPMPMTIGEHIDANFWAHCENWQKHGFAPIRSQWLDRAAGLGSEITVRLPEDTLQGVFEDIDESGGLVLRFEGRTRIINAGDIYFSPRKD